MIISLSCFLNFIFVSILRRVVFLSFWLEGGLQFEVVFGKIQFFLGFFFEGFGVFDYFKSRVLVWGCLVSIWFVIVVFQGFFFIVGFILFLDMRVTYFRNRSIVQIIGVKVVFFKLFIIIDFLYKWNFLEKYKILNSCLGKWRVIVYLVIDFWDVSYSIVWELLVLQNFLYFRVFVV